MNTIALIVLAILAISGWVFSVVVTIMSRTDEALVRNAHVREITARDARIDQLLDQAQLNSQNLPYYPKVGPFPPVEEKKYLASEDGLLVFEDYEDDGLIDLEEVAQ